MADCRCGGNGCGLFVFVWDHDPPPPKEKLFLFRVCFIDETSGEYTRREVQQKLHKGGGGIHLVGGYEAP